MVTVGPPMAPVSAAIGFVLSFLVLTVATHVSTSVFTRSPTLRYSALAALITALVWIVVPEAVSGVVTIGGTTIGAGPLLTVIAYLILIDVLYPGNFGRAVVISAATWFCAFVILFLAASFGFDAFAAVRVPPTV